MFRVISKNVYNVCKLQFFVPCWYAFSLFEINTRIFQQSFKAESSLKFIYVHNTLQQYSLSHSKHKNKKATQVALCPSATHVTQPKRTVVIGHPDNYLKTAHDKLHYFYYKGYAFRIKFFNFWVAFETPLSGTVNSVPYTVRYTIQRNKASVFQTPYDRT